MSGCEVMREEKRTRRLARRCWPKEREVELAEGRGDKRSRANRYSWVSSESAEEKDDSMISLVDTRTREMLAKGS